MTQVWWRYRVGLMALGVALLAAATRLVTLGNPRALVFDELYYARDAFSLMTLGYEGQWGKDYGAFADGSTGGLSEYGAYTVHPPLGKWLIGLGMRAFGVTPFGWRIAGALIGVATVVIVALIARHLFRSTTWGGVAGVLLALDGQHIVMSRHALLDGYMTFFAVVAFGLLLLDRRAARRLLDAAAARDRRRLGLAGDDAIPGWGSRLGPRWWRVAAVVTLGLATSVKWSGLYFAAAFLLWSVVRDMLDRRRAGYEQWLWTSVPRAFVTGVWSVLTVIAVYIASWWHWFASDKAWGRQWTPAEGEGLPFLGQTMQAFVRYHDQMLGFHEGLDAEHPYSSHPLSWIIQLRPVAFYFEDVEGPTDERWVSAITAIGHPMIWWAMPLVLAVLAWRALRHREWLTVDVSIGLFAAWLPWILLHSDRTVFSFYTVAMAPWAVLMVVWALRLVAQPPDGWPHWSLAGTAAVLGYLAVFLAIAAFFVPMWTGQGMTYDYWLIHVWLPEGWL